MPGRTRSSSSVAPTLAVLGCLVLATCGRTKLDSPVNLAGTAGKPAGTGRAGTGAAGQAGAGGMTGVAGDGGAGAGGMAGAITVTGTAGFTGFAGAGGTTGVGGAGGTTSECVDGTSRCASNTTIQLCQGGAWAPTSNCSLICLAGICAECVPGQLQCSGPDTLRTCTNAGLWPEPVVCPSGTCTENHCTTVATDAGAPEGGSCGDGTSECFGTEQVRLCFGGTWGTPFSCEKGCIGGVCAECIPGETRCGGVQVCTAAGVWTGGTGPLCPNGT